MTVYTKAADVAQAITTRLSAISVVGGYETNIGATIFRGRRKLPGDDEPPCIVVIEGDDEVEATSGRTTGAMVKVNQDYMIDAFDVCDPNNPNDKAHAMIRDVKRAIFKDGRTLGGTVVEVEYLGRDIGPRPDGVALVQARVAIRVSFAEDLANP